MNSSLLNTLRQTASKAVAAMRLVGKSVTTGATPADVIYRSNKLQLLRYRRPAPVTAVDAPPILFVPSLINRHYILDLMPGRSLIEYLVDQGYDVLMVKWGTPTAEDRYQTLDEVVDGLLRRCVERAARLSRHGAVTLVGYCMGGTLATIFTALHQPLVANLVCFASPVDFEHAGALGLWTDRRYGFSVDKLVDTLGNVPWPLMQASFHLLVPTATAQKALYFFDRMTDDDYVDNFLALETWGNDNVSFPGECYRRYIKDLYQDNLLVRGGLAINGRPATLDRIACPLLNVIAPTDHIVPPAAALPLVERAKSVDKQTWELRGGHIGAIVSRTASRTFWPRLDQWLADHR